MLLGVIADDFTGASDIANTLAKGLAGEGGLRTIQFLGVPQGPALAACEAGVVSLKSRSIPKADAVSQSLAALDWLMAQGCRQIVFKYCSTFDSTPEGNIGPVGEALAARLGVKGVVACPAFPGAGRTVYRGHLFVHDALLNESGLEHHPLNPMSDANLQRWLRQQTVSPVGLVGWPVIAEGAAPVRSALAAAAARGETLVIADAIRDVDLLVLGEALSDAPLLTGGSGIALGLPRNFIRRGLATGAAVGGLHVAGPEAILAGSCSRTTLAQIAHHREAGHPTLKIDVDAVMSGKLGADDLIAFIKRSEGRAPLVYSTAQSDVVQSLQATFGRDAVAHRLDALFAATARGLVDGGVRRLVVAGGETSGAVVSALGLDALAIGPEVDPGVPVLTLPDGSLALTLKSGNFGSENFFAKALSVMEHGTP
ncbi:MAG: four-carbon acid sugar kinase family protein [Beijerinckiaceae bacterium]|nr:four-carbon acid sugar kinase family protein [Beijerinckiaceae bacterium]